MKKVELLSPAGDMESLKSAVHNGADAIYLSGKNYGARKFASNFDLNEIEEAIKYCHLYGVKVYITVNTLVYNNELAEVMEYIKQIHEFGVDALIMQDIGLIKLVRETYPNLEIHASTQAHNHNKEGLEFFKSLGVTRCVMARELSIAEINSLDVDIEKEVFIHGALCVSYSGECLFSSLALNRSGNRGECAGLCRLPYELLENDQVIDLKEKYLLSLKELNSTENLRTILDSNVNSLKIEGRMKSPEYVGYVTAIYRKLIDKYYNNEEMILTKEELDNLAVLYNREFTKGYINNENNKDIINPKTPNHQGIELGTVLECLPKIKIKLTNTIHQGDGIRLPNGEGMIANFIYNRKDLLVSKGEIGEIIYLDNKVDLDKKGKVLKTLDSHLIKELNNYNLKKIKVDFTVIAKVGKPLIVKISDNINTIVKESIVLEKSINRPTTKTDVIEKLNKLGNTPFILNIANIELDSDVFIPIKEINNLRQQLTKELIHKRENSKREVIVKNNEFSGNSQLITNHFSFLVRNESQLQYLLDKDVIIYTEDYKLYQKYKGPNVFFKTNRVSNKLMELNNENILASDIGAVYKYSKTNNVVSDIYLNVTNKESIELLKNLSVNKIGLSVEIKDDDLIDINNSSNLELLVYGRPELMVMKYCLLNKFVNTDKACSVCHNQKKYAIKGDNKELYPIINNTCISKLLHSKNIDLLNKLDYYKDLGITNFRIDLYDEVASDIAEILKKCSR
ncbi:MAG: U32 family peptidase [Bacilli bacterium]|nr:U32 family peptidase [Bacilli bacterium]